jgi:predicted PurR-regulated permease PerM
MPDTERPLRIATEITIRLGALALLLGWCGVILFPFLLPLAWGGILAIALHGPCQMLAQRLGNRPVLASTLVVLALLGAVILPGILLGNSLAAETQSLVDSWQSGRLTVPEPPAKVAEWPVVGKSVHAFWLLASHNMEAAFTKLQPYLKDTVSWLVAGAARIGLALLEFVLAILIGGALMATAGRSGAGALAFAGRLGGARGHHLAELAIATIRGVTRGILGVALIQALLAGLGLLIAGVPAAGLLTVLMLVMCVVQIGVALVMIPAAIWLFANADPTTAVLFGVWTLLLLPLDNVLKPLLMGRGLDVPILVIFLGAIGGFLSHGIIGLFVGAVVLVLGYELFVQWLREENPGL